MWGVEIGGCRLWIMIGLMNEVLGVGKGRQARQWSFLLDTDSIIAQQLYSIPALIESIEGPLLFFDLRIVPSTFVTPCTWRWRWHWLNFAASTNPSLLPLPAPSSQLHLSVVWCNLITFRLDITYTCLVRWKLCPWIKHAWEADEGAFKDLFSCQLLAPPTSDLRLCPPTSDLRLCSPRPLTEAPAHSHSSLSTRNTLGSPRKPKVRPENGFGIETSENILNTFFFVYYTLI